MHYGKKFILFIIFLVVLLSLSACACNKEVNSRLDFNIKELIQAEKRGEAEEFAQSIDIELVDGSSVKVIIECVPGQCEAAAEAATRVGAEQVGIKEHLNIVRAVVPITRLTTLAKEESIRLIRLPWEVSQE